MEFSLEVERMIYGYYLVSRRIRIDFIYGLKLLVFVLKYL